VEEAQTLEAKLQEEDGRAEGLMRARNDLEEALYAAKGEELGEGSVSEGLRRRRRKRRSKP